MLCCIIMIDYDRLYLGPLHIDELSNYYSNTNDIGIKMYFGIR